MGGHMRRVKCGSIRCDAVIFWAVTRNHKAMPINADPVPDGNAVITTSADGRRVEVEVLTPIEAMLREGDKYMPHHATCPDAAYYRRRGKT